MSPVALEPRPVVGRLAEIAYAEMAPVAQGDAERGWPLLKFLHAYYMPLQEIDDIVRDRPELGLQGWAILFHPDLCPVRYLPFLAMVAGVRLRPGMSEAEMRSRIKARDGIRRCTPDAIKQAAKDNLDALIPEEQRKVILRERFRNEAPNADSPGYFEVLTFVNQTPDSETVRAALLEQKDVGLIMSYRVVSGADWQYVIDENATWQDVVNNFATWQGLIEDHPGT